MKRTVFFAAAFLSLFLATFAWSDSSPPDDPRIVGLSLRQGEEHVLLSASLLAHFDEKAREVLRGGVPFRFEYRIRLTKKGLIIGEKIVRFFSSGNWFMKKPKAGMETVGAEQSETGLTSIVFG